MSTRTCPVCDRVCEGYKDECIGEGCGDKPCKTCSEKPESHVIPMCYNTQTPDDWVDIDTEDDFPE